jgi:hypothetical protein
MDLLIPCLSVCDERFQTEGATSRGICSIESRWTKVGNINFSGRQLGVEIRGKSTSIKRSSYSEHKQIRGFMQ